MNDVAAGESHHSTEPPHVPGRAGFAPVLLVFGLLGAWSQVPFVRATLDAPAGTRFTGAFQWTHDVYHYLSFAQQAEAGRLIFRSKLADEDRAHLFVNLEFLLVGRLSALLGGRPTLAFRLLGLAASLFLLAALDRLLREGGLPATHRIPALLFVATGAGVGGLLFSFTDLTIDALPDLGGGLYPYLALLTNAHWVVGLTLVLATLLASMDTTTPGRRAWFGAFATLVGLVRIYDLGLVLYVYTLSTVLGHPRREWPCRLVALGWLLPIVIYNVVLFTVVPGFSSYVRNPYGEVPPAALGLALAPGLLVVALTRPWRVTAERARGIRLLLACWGTIPLAAPALKGIVPSFQFLVGVGLPWLALAALGLAKRRAWALWLAVPFFCSTAAVEWSLLLRSDPEWHVPAERYDAAWALRGSCAPDDVAFAPQDIGLLAIGLTDCSAFVSHVTGPDFERRRQQVSAFYLRPDRRWRAALLDRSCVTHLVLPGEAGVRPSAWLDDAAGFHRVAGVGSGERRISLYARARPGGCSPLHP